ncbi:chorismate-binding protein, partial [Rahnella sp. C60]|uniref:chorismate-binding protein n=1 Tax=Rahnella perminowiae TaxID=2816244 RepID=UPI001C25D057
DKMTGEIFYYYYDTDHQSNRIDEIKSLLNAISPDYTQPTAEHLGDGMNREQHAVAVMKVKEDIKAGLIFQCEVGFKSHYRIQGDTMPIYSKLREVNPSPHMYYVKFGAQKIIGASPELLFRLRNGEMETFPLAGTTKRGKDETEDRQL